LFWYDREWECLDKESVKKKAWWKGPKDVVVLSVCLSFFPRSMSFWHAIKRPKESPAVYLHWTAPRLNPLRHSVSLDGKQKQNQVIPHRFAKLHRWLAVNFFTSLDRQRQITVSVQDFANVNLLFRHWVSCKQDSWNIYYLWRQFNSVATKIRISGIDFGCTILACLVNGWHVKAKRKLKRRSFSAAWGPTD
jgi:hypothetical protein